MSTEQAADGTQPPAIDPQAQVEIDDDAERMAAALAGLAHLDAPTPSPTPPATEPETPATEAAPPATDAATGLPTSTPAPPEKPPEPLEAVLRQRAVARLAKAAEEEDATELARLREFHAQHQTPAPTRADVLSEFVEAFKGDPVAFMVEHGIDLEASLKTLTASVLDPRQAAMQRQLSELKAAPRTAAADPADLRSLALDVYREQHEIASLEDEFDALCLAKTGEGDAAQPQYPLLASMSRAERIKAGNEIGLEFKGSFDPDKGLGQIAEILHGRREADYLSITGEAAPHLRLAAPSGTPPTTPLRAVVTNELAASGGPRAPLTDEERETAAEAILNRAFTG